MSIRKIMDSLSNLETALSKIDNCIKSENISDITIDATLHRFEIIQRLTWKLLDRALNYEGLNADTPRNNLKIAYSIDWIKNELIWLRILEINNQIVHAYVDAELSYVLFKQIQTLIPEIRIFSNLIKERYHKEIKTTKRQHAV